MTEQDRMRAGYIWLDDDENMALQPRCKTLVEKFNSMPADAHAERMEISKEIFGECGSAWIIPPLKVTIGSHSSVGDSTYINMGATLIMPGVTIGENSVIGAGSVVTKDIPANVVAFGSPCKVYREINEHDEEYYFRDRRFDEQPSREEKDIPHLDFWEN